MKITKRGEEFGTVTDLTQVGDTAPNFEMRNLDNELISLEDFDNDIILLSVFPDINTSVCDMQTRRFFEDASKYENVSILNVSNNTIEELSNWCATAGIDVAMLSDTELDFANAYGLFIPEVGVLARSIFLIDRDKKIVYKEVLSEVTDEPNYDAVFEETQKLV